MKRIVCLFLLFTIGLSSAFSEEVTIAVGDQFRDTDGNLVQAHGGGILKYDGYYYWFGENRSGDNLVACYRSRNFKDWEFRNNVLRRSFHSELQTANIERPKVIYNPSTGKFIMWAHKEMQSDYGQARACVAVCDRIDGNYTWLRSFRPLNHMSRDCTLFVDDNGRAYFISAANENYDLHIYRLTADFLDVEALLYNFDGFHREAPAIFKHQGTYFLVTSGATGWDPNQGQYATATSLSGPWSGWRNIGNSTTFQSQPTYIQPITGSEGTSYLYMGDRWAGAWDGPVNDSRYVWLPICVTSSNSITLPYSNGITLNAETGLLLNGMVVKENNKSVIYLNDTAEGNGLNNFDYAGDWSYGAETNAYEGDNHWSGDANEYYEVRFKGIQIELYGGKASNHGMAAVSVDASAETMVDFYASSRSDKALLYTSPLLAYGNHSLKVRVTASKNSNSGGTAITADMVKITVSDGSTETPSPSPEPTPIVKAGDVNSDGQVNIVDALLVAQYYVGLLESINFEAADVNRDNTVNIVDALLIARAYVGLENIE
ncbi:MAG: family 43 glycosylhydrolase [Spirochaetales bacterium]|nr:family 43 glycosylhydrolase [Spirochaetales bacterium]